MFNSFNKQDSQNVIKLNQNLVYHNKKFTLKIMITKSNLNLFEIFGIS